MSYSNSSVRKLSRDIDWTSTNRDPEAINMGSLLRIADSLETISKNYNQLLVDMSFYKRQVDSLAIENVTLQRKLNAQKKTLKTLRDKLKEGK